MSSKLVSLQKEQQKQLEEVQRSQYACVFALAVAALNHYGGSVTLLTDDINASNVKMINFEAVTQDGRVLTPDLLQKGDVPIGVRCVLQDPPASLFPKTTFTKKDGSDA